MALITGALALLTWVNVAGVQSGARTAVAFSVTKLVPLASFIVAGLFFMDWSLTPP